MTPEMILDLFRDALYVVILMVAAVIVPGLGIGLIVSVFQAATQINEQTLSFIPRLLITLLALMVLGPWLMELILNFTEELVHNIGDYVR